jgi:hypothetical protein
LAAPWINVTAAKFSVNATGEEPEQGTELRCAWDGTNLRVLFVCTTDHEPWATITQRDGPLWEEEVVEVFLDPVGDGECYFEIEVNPLNTVLDLVLRRNRSGYRKDFAWDCEGLQAIVQRTAAGWNAELAIPIASLSGELPKSASATWRANFTRIDRPRDKPRELTAWSPTRLATFHAPDRFGVLRFGQRISEK